MSSKARVLIGTATQTFGRSLRTHRCYGTVRDDIPDPRFRINVLLVEHDGNFPVHSHEYWELVIVLQGQAIHRSDEVDSRLATGDVFVIHGDQRHGFVDACGLKLCNVQFDPKQFLAEERDLQDMAGYHALFDLEPRSRGDRGFRQRLTLSESQLIYVRSLIETMAEEFAGSAEGRQTIVKGTFLLLVTTLSRYYSAVTVEATPVTRMAGVVSHIRHNFRGPIRIQELAKIAHLSPSQFQRVFKRVFGTSPIQSINRLRIEEAAELLRSTDRGVTSIAAEIGFGTASFLCVQFKRQVGVSPSRYRAEQQHGLRATGSGRDRGLNELH